MMSENNIPDACTLCKHFDGTYTLADLQAAREEERERCVDAVIEVIQGQALRKAIDAIRALGDKENKS